MQYSQSKVHLNHRWQLQKLWMSKLSYQDAQDKQRTQYQLTPRSKWQMSHRYWKFQSQNVQIFGYVYQNTSGQNQGPAWKTQWFPLSEICTAILWQDYYGKGNSRSFCWKTVGEKPQLGNVFVKLEIRLLLSVHVDDKKIAGRKQNIDPVWKVLIKEVDLGEPTSFLDHVNLGCTQGECETSKDSVDNNRNMFEYRISGRAEEKLPRSRKLDPDISSWSYDVEGRAKKMCGAILRADEQNNPATVQSYNSMPGWPSMQTRWIGICRRIVKSMLSNCPQMPVFGTHW